MLSKALSVFMAALLVAGVHGIPASRKLAQFEAGEQEQQQPEPQQQQMQLPAALEEQALRVGAPLTEDDLNIFQLTDLVPEEERQQAAEALQQSFENPDDFRQTVTELAVGIEGLPRTAAAFAYLFEQGQAQQAAQAIGQSFGAFGQDMQEQQEAQTGQTGQTLPIGETGQQQQEGQQQGIAAQAGQEDQITQRAARHIFNAYGIAVIDLISREDSQNAGEAIWWALSGVGGEGLASTVTNQLATFQTIVGCTSPLRDALRAAGENASQWQEQQGTMGEQQQLGSGQQQETTQEQPLGTGSEQQQPLISGQQGAEQETITTGTGMDQQEQQEQQPSLDTFAQNIQNWPTLEECFIQVYPEGEQLLMGQQMMQTDQTEQTGATEPGMGETGMGTTTGQP